MLKGGFESVEHVLLSFDIDCCRVGYDGKDCFAARSGLRALRHSVNVVDPTCGSDAFEFRLLKYARRGFAIGVPGFESEPPSPSAPHPLDTRPRRWHMELRRRRRRRRPLGARRAAPAHTRTARVLTHVATPRSTGELVAPDLAQELSLASRTVSEERTKRNCELVLSSRGLR